MVSDRLALLRRKSAVVWAIIAAAIIVVLAFNSSYYMESTVGVPAMICIWLLASAWVWLDSGYRGKASFMWMIFTLITGPVALLFYLVSRPAVSDICPKCGNQIGNQQDACPSCGNQSFLEKAAPKLRMVWQDLLRSIAGGPAGKAKETVRHLAIGAAVATVFLWVLCSASQARIVLFPIMLLLSAASYWVLVAWWVHLDATWRRMEAVPWGLLTLVTNIFGLVTYLVIRYPEPRTCPQCSASLPTHLKRCPYCGSEVEPACPRCQSSVQSDWLFCPACSAQITRPQSAPIPASEGGTDTQPAQASICIRGTVLDAVTGSPVADAEVKIDSRSNGISTTTNEQGRFELSDMPLQPYVLLGSADGYAVDAKAFEPSAGAAAQVHFALQPLVIEASSVSS